MKKGNVVVRGILLISLCTFAVGVIVFLNALFNAWDKYFDLKEKFILAIKQPTEEQQTYVGCEMKNEQEVGPIFLWGEKIVSLQSADTMTEAIASKTTYEMNDSGESMFFYYQANNLEEEAVISVYHVSEKGEFVQEKPYLVKKGYELSLFLEKGIYCVCVTSNGKERYCIFRLKMQ